MDIVKTVDLTEQSLISVIVPVYKVENYFVQCIESIICQSYKNLEIILVDDGSPDQCPMMCDAYAKKDQRIRVIHKINEGQSTARNVALELCNGEFIAFVDSDDWLEKDAYSQMMNMMQTHNLDVVFCTANIVRNGEIVEQRFRFFENETIKSPKEIMKLALCDQIGGQLWIKLFRRNCWEKLRFPEGRTYEDLAISFLPFVNAYRLIGFIDHPLYNYRLNSEGTSLGESPCRLYCIFLAFLDHYSYAKNNCHEVEQICLSKTAAFAIGCYNDWLRFQSPEMKECIPFVKEWLSKNKKEVLGCTQLSYKRLLMLRIYYFSKKLYKIFYKISLTIRFKKQEL